MIPQFSSRDRIIVSESIVWQKVQLTHCIKSLPDKGGWQRISLSAPNNGAVYKGKKFSLEGEHKEWND
jgi:hypothetical protein